MNVLVTGSSGLIGSEAVEHFDRQGHRVIGVDNLRFLNLGCGERFHPDWVNLDLHLAGPAVRRWDLRDELPFADGFFDVVYHSHVLEHFHRAEGLRLLKQCHRVLRSGGTIRVAVPDLERIARLYLEALEGSLTGDPAWRARYEWMLLEMYDQTVRETSGGEMLAYVRRDPLPEAGFVAARLGGELRRMTAPPASSPARRSFSALPSFVLRQIARLALGRGRLCAYDLGQFRLSGEVHRWMYDRYSLARSLEGVGFAGAEVVGAAESRIPGWAGFHLDTEPDGSVYKPDSLYMEAVKP
jgi:SAM-dependent methyltransferase